MKSIFLVGLGCLLAFGCSQTSSKVKKPVRDNLTGEFVLTTLENGEPSHVTVQHILIAFDGSLPGEPVPRTEAEAQQLANELLEKAIAGDDFGELVKSHSDDEPPGLYMLANNGQPDNMRSVDRSKWVLPRTNMVSGFGDVSFSLDVGEIGMAAYSKGSSPYGWHIIKRIK